MDRIQWTVFVWVPIVSILAGFAAKPVMMKGSFTFHLLAFVLYQALAIVFAFWAVIWWMVYLKTVKFKTVVGILTNSVSAFAWVIFTANLALYGYLVTDWTDGLKIALLADIAICVWLLPSLYRELGLMYREPQT